ncbi:MAG: phospholipase D-like domain-containing protein [Candidatus Levyibacteriota bacterium]
MNNSSLYDENTFYQAFLQDLEHCQKQVVIESPFITTERMRTFDGIFRNLVERGIKIYIVTRDPKEHGNGYEIQSEDAIKWYENIGIQVLLCSGNHHRKLAILDKKILWEGSLNILSQIYSREIMRRIDNKELTEEMISFLKFDKFL